MTPQTEQDIKWMQHAIKLAQHAESIDEVPVGAVIVQDNKLTPSSWRHFTWRTQCRFSISYL